MAAVIRHQFSINHVTLAWRQAEFGPPRGLCSRHSYYAPSMRILSAVPPHRRWYCSGPSSLHGLSRILRPHRCVLGSPICQRVGIYAVGAASQERPQ